ncbi:TonB-dependent receptor [Chitinophaga silvatica]|uniref:TonB-dependent receptor n=1 Tax=Chitinophaga silvatica TaxID=2282649 RepID=A0A3E1YA50_9BACT|nr:carboxypeptidase regulatory-like domain-containing protein [Chitinophaga silvatica]RFS22506.1 TonB-dependent receptor [Chitinophaga silvatica]
MKSFFTLLVSLFVIAFYNNADAQVTTAVISGKVSDPGGQAIPGVTVVLVNTSTGARSGVQTNTDGRYILPNLNPGGPYTITVSFIGYKKETKSDVNLPLGSSTYNFKLQEESTALSEVVVTGNAGAGKSGTRIGQEQIKNMPSTSRSLQDLTKVTPQSNNNSFLGTNYRYNNVTLDGAINNDAIGFSPSLGGQSNTSGQPGSSTRTNPVSIDAIQDVQVLLAPFDVKVGNFLGGSVNAVTRSGTNEVHGSIYGFGRNASMIGKNNAGDGSKLPSDFHEYQTGVRIGFPIIKNKLFFFTNEEITRRVDPVILAAGSVDNKILTVADAEAITNKMLEYGVNPGTAGNTSMYSNSNKFFNRLDWHINDKHQLSLRNNTITSEATNLERDQQNFRFKGIDFKQVNNQSSTVAELKSNFSSTLSNSLILGYSNIHDYRDPLSDPAVPQIQIGGRIPGSTIFLGTDREASIFNMKQKTFEVTDNVTIFKGKHTFTIGTHNEFYNITYGFVNSWNGRVDYKTIQDFLDNKPSRVRGNYNYTNNSRDYIMANPPAQFKVNLMSLYGQDDIQLTDRFKITPGVRFDYAGIPNKQPLSDKTIKAPIDPNYGNTYTYTKPQDIKNNFLNNVQISPRLGFNYDIKGDNSMILRGGSGLFTGRIPFAWLGYAYYNNGVTYGAYDATSPAVNTPLPAAKPSKNGIADYAAQNGQKVNDAGSATQVDMIDNNFKMPQAWRSSLAFEYNTRDMWKFSIEGIYTKVIYDLMFQQVNIADEVKYYEYDVNHQQPIYVKNAGNNNGKINTLFTNAYLLSNTNKGYRYSITAQVSKSFPFGLSFMTAYTYGQAKDITNGIRNSMESNWQLNQALNPNNPGLAYSNFDIRNRIVATANYKQDWGTKNKWVSNFSVFFNTSSGTPFTYGFVNATVQNTPQQVSLAYIPKDVAEATNFFNDGYNGKTAAQQATEFMNYVSSNKYLNSRKGQFTERNGGRTPWNTQADFRFSQDFNFTAGKKTHTITLTYDIINLTNLLNKEWGIQYFTSNTFNSTSSVGLTSAGKVVNNYPTYTFGDPGTPYSKDFFSSRHQMQLGLRYSF